MTVLKTQVLKKFGNLAPERACYVGAQNLANRLGVIVFGWFDDDGCYVVSVASAECECDKYEPAAY